MKSEFRGYYLPTNEEMTEIWDTGLIVLDTNVLLHLFRYSLNAREDFFKALGARSDSLWIPHQVGAEFHRRRIEIINAQNKAFGAIEDALSKAKGQVQSVFNLYKRHPSLEVSPLSEKFGEMVEELLASVKAERQSHELQMIANKENEVILKQITDLYHGNVGEPFVEDRLTEIYAEGEIRYENMIPPGYADRKKSEPSRYGDLVLWKQLLDHVAQEKRPAIFVTDDRKEDWWYTVDGDRHGARPELVDEYFVASGKRVHLMTSDRFLDFAKTKLVDIRTASVDEAEELSKDSATWSFVTGPGHSGSSRESPFESFELDTDSQRSRRVSQALRDRHSRNDRIHELRSELRSEEVFATQLKAKLKDFREQLEDTFELKDSATSPEIVSRWWRELQESISRIELEKSESDRRILKLHRSLLALEANQWRSDEHAGIGRKSGNTDRNNMSEDGQFFQEARERLFELREDLDGRLDGFDSPGVVLG